MTKRWPRDLGALLVAVLVGLGIRSFLLPAHSAFVFLDYAEGVSWEAAPESKLFEGGDLAFAGCEPIQLGGDDLGAWDEVAIVDFRGTADYRAFVERIAAARDARAVEPEHTVVVAKQNERQEPDRRERCLQNDLGEP